MSETHEPARLTEKEEFALLVKAANDGDENALDKLRQVLDLNPQIWQTLGDMAMHARMSLIRAIARKDQLLSESLHRRTREMERELAGPFPTPLEKLAVERIVANWLEIQFIATLNPQPHGETFKLAKFTLQRRESAEKRFNAAVKSLEVIRKMLPAAAKDADRNAGLGAHGSNGHSQDTAAKDEAHKGNGKASGIPQNRVRSYLRPKSNGHTSRLKVYAGEPSGNGEPAATPVL